MLSTTLQETLPLLYLQVVLLLLTLYRLSPLQVRLYLVQYIIYPTHLLQPLDCTHLFRLFLSNISILAIEDILMLALINKL